MASGLIDTKHFSGIGDVIGFAVTATGLLAQVGNEQFRVDVVREDILRLKLSHAGGFEEQPSGAAVLATPSSAPFEVAETPDSIALITRVLRLVVDKRCFSFEVVRNDGSPVLQSAAGPDGSSRAYRRLNDAFLVERRISSSDSIYGLGEKTGRFERRGREFVLWNVDVLAPNVLATNRLHEADRSLPGSSTRFDPYYTSIPFFQHVTRHGGNTRAAGFFLDNPYKAAFDFASDDVLRFQFAGGQYTEYVFAGPDLPAVLEAYTFVTGRMQLPPLWSLGHHQCRWHDYTDQQVIEVGRQYRRRGIPCDVLWLDIGHMDGYRVFTWDEARFPSPERAIAAMHADGFRCVTIVDPGLKFEPGYAVFDEARRRNLLCKTEAGAVYVGQVWPGHTAFPDFVKPEARAFWADLVRQHVERGVDGIWNDMNEPATGEIPPFAMRFDRDGANHAHERFHNEYASLMAAATEDGIRAARPTLRPFILSRAGFAGIQRVAAQWLGDNSSNWDHLAMSVPMALGMGISGQAFVGADIPGFMDRPTRELAARWFQSGALMPFCRCHNVRGSPDQYPWSFGSEVEAVARAAISLRYTLLPYLYAAFLRATETGEPVQRALVFDYPNDEHARDVEDQFSLGECLLVAPVLSEGATVRRVYLPAGTWFDWHSQAVFQGGGFVDVPAPLTHVPLFARAGSVIPTFEVVPQTTFGLAPELIELHVFAPDAEGEGRGLLYEDDGVSVAHRTGAFVRTELRVSRRGDTLSLRAQSQGNGFPEMRRTRLRVRFHGFRASRIQCDGARAALESDGSVAVQNRGEPFELHAVTGGDGSGPV